MVPVSTQQKILAFLKENPDASIPELMSACGFVSRNTAYYHLRRLEEIGALTRPKVKRTGWKVTAELSPQLSTPGDNK